MLTYDLERRGDLPRYDYLYRCIKGDILSGRLAAGEKLPSKRALAAHLGTAVVTVENAYAQLLAEGYLTSRERSGCYVAQVETRQSPPPPPAPVQTVPERRWLLDLRGVGSGIEGFPFSVWARLTRQVLSERGEELLRSVPHNGVLELRQAISRHLYRFRGMEVPPEQIVVGAGAEYLYNLIVQLLGRELTYGVEDPGYSKAAKIYRLNGAACAFLPMDGQGISPKTAQERRVEVLHLSPNHQFPTGVVMPIARRQGLLRWAEEGERRYLVEDDYDSEFRFTGRPIPALQSADQQGRVIYVNTFSRTLAPSLRISYMVLPQGLMERYQDRLGFYACTVPAIEQYTLAQFLEKGHFESHISRMRVFYRGQRDRIIDWILTSPLAGRCRVLREEAGLHFLLELDTSRPDQALRGLTEEQGIRLSFLTDYENQEGSARPHTLVVNYPGVGLEHLEQALERLAGLL